MSIIHNNLCKDYLTDDWISLITDTFRGGQQNVESRLPVTCRDLTLDRHIEVEQRPLAQLFQLVIAAAHIVVDNGA